MNIAAKKTNGACKLRIDGEMTIYNAGELKAGLIENLSGCVELCLDLSKVSEMDTAGFQLLMLAKREAAKSGKGFSITAHSKATAEVVELYKLGHLFGQAAKTPKTAKPVKKNKAS